MDDEEDDYYSAIARYRQNHPIRYRREVKLLFKWYDLWVGFFWDRSKKHLYFFPVPMFGVVIKFKEEIK